MSNNILVLFFQIISPPAKARGFDFFYKNLLLMIQLPIKLFFIREIMKVKRSTVYGTSTIPWAMNQIPDYNLDIFPKSTRNFITSLLILVLFTYACKPFSIRLIIEFKAVLAILPLASCLARDKRSYTPLTC